MARDLEQRVEGVSAEIDQSVKALARLPATYWLRSENGNGEGKVDPRVFAGLAQALPFIEDFRFVPRGGGGKGAAERAPAGAAEAAGEHRATRVAVRALSLDPARQLEPDRFRRAEEAQKLGEEHLRLAEEGVTATLLHLPPGLPEADRKRIQEELARVRAEIGRNFAARRESPGVPPPAPPAPPVAPLAAVAAVASVPAVAPVPAPASASPPKVAAAPLADEVFVPGKRRRRGRRRDPGPAQGEGDPAFGARADRSRAGGDPVRDRQREQALRRDRSRRRHPAQAPVGGRPARRGERRRGAEGDGRRLGRGRPPRSRLGPALRHRAADLAGDEGAAPGHRFQLRGRLLPGRHRDSRHDPAHRRHGEKRTAARGRSGEDRRR